MKAHILPALVLASFAGVAIAADTESTEKKPEKKICRSEPVTGSRTHVNTICMTREEWDEVSHRTREGLDSISRNATSGLQNGKNPMGPGPGGF